MLGYSNTRNIRTVCAALGLTMLSGFASAADAHGGKATSSAELDFRIIVPHVLQILENSHPTALPPPDRQTSRVSALQKLVLVSTLRRGFCMQLQMNAQTLSDWQLQINTNSGAWLQPGPSGYQLCTARPGRYDVALRHEFNATSPTDVARAWPVQVSLTTP